MGFHSHSIMKLLRAEFDLYKREITKGRHRYANCQEIM